MRLKVIMVVLFLGLLYLGLSFLLKDQGFYDYSEGYRMGTLSKFSITGIIYKTGEGSVLMGNGSSDWHNADSTIVNPWKFSSSKSSSLVEKLDGYANMPVVIRYKQYQFGPLNWETNYEVLSIDSVNTHTQIDEYATEQNGSRSSGFIAGRVVKVSHKGTIKKTYEIILQTSEVGNNFRAYSTTDPVMYDKLLSCLKTGRMFTFWYSKSFIRNPFAEDTNYNIWKVSNIKK